MPAYTYQIAINESDNWTREYVCAENKYKAVNQFLTENPMFSLERLQEADEFEVEACV